MAMRIINSDRMAVCQQSGFWAEIIAIPRYVTNKNIIICNKLPIPVPTTWAWRMIAPILLMLRVVVPKSSKELFRTYEKHCSLYQPPTDALVFCGDFTKACEEEGIDDFVSGFSNSHAYTRLLCLRIIRRL